MNRVNQDVAGRLEEAARLLQDQGADRYRVGAYLRAASTIRSTEAPVDEVLRDHGLDGLKQLP
jgi:putative hydrolase